MIDSILMTINVETDIPVPHEVLEVDAVFNGDVVAFYYGRGKTGPFISLHKLCVSLAEVLWRAAKSAARNEDGIYTPETAQASYTVMLVYKSVHGLQQALLKGISTAWDAKIQSGSTSVEL